MPVLITPGAFTRASSFTRLADRLGAHVVERPLRAVPQLDVGGLESIERGLAAAIVGAEDDGTPRVLIGHSMGGLLTLRTSLTHPIDAQVLLMPAPPEGLASHIARMTVRDPLSAIKFGMLCLSILPARTGSIAPPKGLYTAGAPSKSIAEAAAHRADESWSALLQLLVGTRAPVHKALVPTLVVSGLQDGLVPPSSVRRLAERLGADYLEFDVAHNFSEEPAGTVVEDAVETWLRERSLLGPRT